MTAAAEKSPDETRGARGEVTPLAGAERAGKPIKPYAHELRKARSRKLLRRLAVFVALPTALATVYYSALASDQFESYSSFTVQSSELRPTLGMEGLLAGLAPGNGGTHDALAVRDYVLSRDMLARLDKEHGFIAHYKNRNADFFSRLEADASFEDAFEYFRHKVHADYDQLSGSVTLHVRAFDAQKAAELSRGILAYSEEMVNKLSERERKDRTGYAEAEVKKAEERLSLVRKGIVALQQKHGDFSPLQTAAATMEVRTHLEGELAKARAELMQLKAYMNDDAPQVLAAGERVRSLSAQVSGESRRLVDPAKPSGLSTALADFDAAMVEKEFSQKAYESALTTLELARADADRQHRYLAVIANPSTPDESTYPHRVRGVLTAFLLSFLLLGVGSLIGAAVKEHARL
jgi:capsular polysaccharide transport system permease protein